MIISTEGDVDINVRDQIVIRYKNQVHKVFVKSRFKYYL